MDIDFEPNVNLIVGPQIEWSKIAIETAKLTIRPKTNEQTWNGLLALLSHIEHGDYVIKSDNVLKHLHFTFSIEYDPQQYEATWMQYYSELDVLYSRTRDDTTFLIVSGTLDRWFKFTFDACHTIQQYTMRKIGGKVYLIMQELGFGLLWKNSRRISQPDQTFTLEKT